MLKPLVERDLLQVQPVDVSLCYAEGELCTLEETEKHYAEYTIKVLEALKDRLIERLPAFIYLRVNDEIQRAMDALTARYLEE